jgi:hypothetical protein
MILYNPGLSLNVRQSLTRLELQSEIQYIHFYVTTRKLKK